MQGLALLYAIFFASYCVLMFVRMAVIMLCDDSAGRTYRQTLTVNKSVYMFNVAVVVHAMHEKLVQLGKTEAASFVFPFARVYSVSTVIQFCCMIMGSVPAHVFMLFSILDIGTYAAIVSTAIPAFRETIATAESEINITEQELREDLTFSPTQRIYTDSQYIEESVTVKSAKSAVFWGRLTTYFAALSVMTTVTFLIARSLNNSSNFTSGALQAFAAVALVGDMIVNAFCSLLLSGLIGPRMETLGEEHEVDSQARQVQLAVELFNQKQVANPNANQEGFQSSSDEDEDGDDEDTQAVSAGPVSAGPVSAGPV
jgi:hypothetical protein